MSQTVVVLHGLGQKKISMAVLAARLKRAGFQTENYEYPTRSGDIGAHVAALEGFLSQFENTEISFVAHSLGGIVARTLVLAYPDRFSYGRLVMIGSPNQGSSFARGLERLLSTKVSHRIWGPSFGGLARLALGHESGNIRIGVIAGDCRVPIWPFLERGHDGLVSVAETKFNGAAEHVVIPAWHGTLPFKRNVADLAVRFLRTGSFAERREQVSV